MSTRGIKPPARLEPRNEFERMVSDGRPSTANVITYEELKTISIFKDVKYERIDLRALPGTIVLRRFVKDEDICLQDNPGYTAFYLLTGKEITELKLAPLKEAAGQSDRVVSVTRAVSVGSGRKKETVRDTAYMGEGELFGEMSCLYRVPRSATVRATRDCYVLEFLRNVLDKINAGPFRNQLDEMYRKRFLELHLRNLELFRNLSDAAYAELRDKVELRALTPGEMLFDEHDSPDGLYIIRSGFVKIIKNISALLGKDSMADWSAFYAALIEGGKETGARHELWKWVSQALPELGKKLALSDSGERDVTEEEQRELLYSLNDLLKKKDFATRIGFAFAGSTAEWADEAKQLAATKKEDPVKIRRFNRQLLESLYPKLIQAYGVDPPRVLAYRSSPEWVSASAAVTVASNADSSFIGEIGMLDNTPRSATCVAYAQSNDRYGGVHVVYVDKQLYQKLVSTVNQATEGKSEARVKQVATERKAETSARMSLPVWQQESTRQQFEELGLIQGQKLMLIDLDRCTRCDKCVEACVESHSPVGSTGSPF